MMESFRINGLEEWCGEPIPWADGIPQPKLLKTNTHTNDKKQMPTLSQLNTLSDDQFKDVLSRCCGSSAWVQKMAQERPFENDSALLDAADLTWEALSEVDWREAFAHHPQIGDRESLKKKFTATASWAGNEQAGTATATDEVLDELGEYNRQYLKKFGYIFIVCATGKSASEMLSLLKQRIDNAPENEIRIAAGEQQKITRLRLQKLLNGE